MRHTHYNGGNQPFKTLHAGSMLTIYTSPLPFILRSFHEVSQKVIAANTSIEKVLCSALNFYRNFKKFGAKINKKDKEAFEKILITEMNGQLVEQLASRKSEIKLSHTEALVMILSKIPAEMWKMYFPEIRIYETCWLAKNMFSLCTFPYVAYAR